MQVLFVSSWYPVPPDNGSKIRAYNLLRVLARHHDVTVISFTQPEDIRDAWDLTSTCRVAGTVAVRPFRPRRIQALLGYLAPQPRSIIDTYSPEMSSLLRQVLGHDNYDVQIASEISAARYISRDLPTPSLFDEAQLSVIRDAYVRAASWSSRTRNWLTWTKSRCYTATLIRRFAACTVASEAERANLREIAPAYDRVEIVPNGVDTDELRVSDSSPRPYTLVYNGALTYSANLDAMRFFLAQVWPLIKMSEESVCLEITGRHNGVPLTGLPLDGKVTLTGYLPDVRPTVSSAWACVVPLRIGGGTRLKILEAMALGTPVVATTKGAEGLAVTHDENILIADDPQQFAGQVIRLLRDPALRGRLAENARQLVEEKYSWQMIGKQFTDLVEAVARGERIVSE